MKRIGLGIAIASILGLSAPALAADHNMKVGEVLLSQGGDGTAQYIELQDPGEGFPATTYEIEIYDTNGGTLGVIPLAIAGGTKRFLVATGAAATAFGVSADATLTVTLPTPGQACFEKSGNTRIQCLSWGTVNTPVTGGFTDTGASPPDGQSLARSGMNYVLGAPTPENFASTMVDAGPTVDSGSDSDANGDGPDGGGPGADNDGGGGCGCRSAGGGGAGGLAFMVLGLVLALRRRRRR